MKLEVDRVYVLVDEEISNFSSNDNIHRLVKFIDAVDGSSLNLFCDVEGFYISDNGKNNLLVKQTVRVESLKPASEKQRVMYKRKAALYDKLGLHNRSYS